MSRINNECVKGILRTKGTRYVNGDGEPVVLTGYAIGNWQNPEGFMTGQPPRPLEWVFPKDDKMNMQRFDRRRTISQTVRELCGSKYLEDFWDRWEAAYTGEDDIRAMAEIGWNSVRVVLDCNALMYDEPGIEFNEKAFARLDQIFDWCEKYKIYIILDMHASVGGINGCCGDALFNHYPSLLMDDESMERQIILWEELTRRYCDRWILAGYDLANEPVSTPPAFFAIPKLDEYYTKCIERMRAIDKGAHIFFLEGPAFARSNEIFNHDYDPGFHNWAINVHIYGADCSLKDLRPYVLKSMELNVPIWISESGSSPISNAVFYDICAEMGIGYSIWCWKTAMRGGMTRSVGQPLPRDWDKIEQYILGGPRPSYEKCQAIFDEYLENLLYKNCTHNKEYTRISRKIPDIDIPGAGYDMWTPDGKRYTGSWEWSNLLEFRAEDRTKLVWATDKRDPYPHFGFDCGPNPEPVYDPMTDLALEITEGENAWYSVNEVKPGCKVALEAAGSGAEVQLLVKGNEIGRAAVPAAGIMSCTVTEDFEIPAGDRVTVEIRVVSGTLQIKNVKFSY